ncbi:MAG: protease modulator HflC [Verrucomicrobiales bacterium]|nr:protease modulator HflC [Verrucomicrobiae bacterium]
MKTIGLLGFVAIIIAAIVVSGSAFYTTDETQQAIITQFGKPIGKPVTEAGLHFKKPFVEEATMIDKRVLEWDGLPSSMPTKDKVYIVVDTFARWQITDALQFYERLRDERSAMSRLDDILGSETRNTVAKHEFIEIVRTTKEREAVLIEELEEGADVGGAAGLVPIQRGRTALEMEIFAAAKDKLADFGIVLLDIRLKRINYNQAVSQNIYKRMISERQQIAERFRSEGAGEAARIKGNKERDLQRIESEAYKKIQEIQGAADAQASQIYADAYNQSPAAVDFYRFQKTMESYEQIISSDTTLILSTDSDVFSMLKTIEGDLPIPVKSDASVRPARPVVPATPPPSQPLELSPFGQ